jgi:aminocarboxymuconate-semialdehyde decarboxylase
MLNWRAKYPDRISSYVMLPLPHIDASLKEMARGLEELGWVGVNMNIVCLGDAIGKVSVIISHVTSYYGSR